MIWVLVLFVIAMIAVGIGVYITRGTDDFDTGYDDPLLEDVFPDPTLDYTPDTPTRIYDSQGNLIFGQQDDTNDLDEPKEVDDLA